MDVIVSTDDARTDIDQFVGRGGKAGESVLSWNCTSNQVRQNPIRCAFREKLCVHCNYCTCQEWSAFFGIRM